MMKYFNAAFHARIGQAISRIESQSDAELVVIVKSRATSYSEYPLGVGISLAFLSLTIFRFAPPLFAEWIIYAGTLSAFVLGAVLTGGIPGLLRLVVGRKRLKQSAEIMARACFQKGGIHHTCKKTGVLIFIALLEREILIIPDRGIESAIPPGEWARMRQDFLEIFREKNPADALAAKLESMRSLFSRYLPQVEKDVNELPDAMEIDL